MQRCSNNQKRIKKKTHLVQQQLKLLQLLCGIYADFCAAACYYTKGNIFLFAADLVRLRTIALLSCYYYCFRCTFVSFFFGNFMISWFEFQIGNLMATPATKHTHSHVYEASAAKSSSHTHTHINILCWLRCILRRFSFIIWHFSFQFHS